MFRLLARKMRHWQTSNHTSQNRAQPDNISNRVSPSLENNLQALRESLGQSNDVIIRAMKIRPDSDAADAAVIYIDGLVDRNLLNHDILQPLMFNLPLLSDRAPSSMIDYIRASVLTVGQINGTQNIDRIAAGVLSGNIAVLAEDETEVLLIDAKGWEQRNIEAPENEVSIRGPKESFTETLRTNTALMRRKIRDPRLTFQSFKIGLRSQTDVSLVYMKGITPNNLVEEINQRLERINADIILDAGYIEQFIEDNPTSLFATVGTSERPDVVAARILEGRAAILVDGSPMALTVPYLFIEGFQNPDDYYSRPFFVTMTRWIRLLGFIISVYLPGVFVSLSSFHPELLPTPLLVSVAASREGIPLPVVLEALLMLFLFEILREAGLRMPRSLGQAVSIVGALVIGQSAVSAGLVGAPMVIVIATTAITSFLAESQYAVGALLRFKMTIVSGFIGLFGIIMISIEVISHLASLRSLGVPYLSPVTPLNIRGLQDTIIRAPLWAMDNRPEILEPVDVIRQSPGQMPEASESTPKRREGL